MSTPHLLDLVQRPGHPDGSAPAVVSADGTLSYDELWRRVHATASLLDRSGVRPGDRVGLYFHRGPDYVTALLATFHTGAVAVPIDAEYPAERVDQILGAADPRVVLRGRDGRHEDEVLRPDRWIDATTAAPLPDAPAPARAAVADPDGPALILFTSGSTGKPKGVVLHHTGVCNRLEWGQRRYGIDASDRVLHKASIAFDASLHEILSPLMAGGTLVIAPPGLQFDSRGLIELIQDERITTAHFVPSMLRYVLDESDLEFCQDLRRVYCGGEALDMGMVRRFRAALPDTELFNQYGPTETSLSVTYWDTAEPFDGDIAPIGRAIDGAELHVLTEEMEPVADGDTGELWIGGIQVGVGYLDDPAQTRERFRDDPSGVPGARVYRTGDLVRRAPAGYLEFRGRVDDQVKIRGVRVEPAEVGAVLRRHPLVHDAAVVATHDDEGATGLVAYVAARRRNAQVVDGLHRTPLPNGLAVTAASPEEALFLYRQIFEEDEYARFGVHLTDGAVVVDVGANIGLFSLWAHRQASGVRLVSVEPNPDVLPYLRANLDVHGVHADIVPLAVTRTAGTEELTSFPQLSYLSGLGESRERAAAALVDSYYRRTAAAGGDTTGDLTAEETAALRRQAEGRLDFTSHVVETTDLSSLLDRFGLDRVDLLKINTEGAELDVLRSVRPEHWASVRQVCLEVERSSVVGDEIRSLLKDAGYTVHEVGDWSLGADADVTYVYAVRPEADAAPTATTTLPEPVEPLLTAKALRTFTADALPPAMRPDHIVFVEDLPRLPNGKVSRAALPEPPRRATAPDEGADRSAEERLREIWRQALGVDAVADDDDFIALGGHSLMALRISVRARAELGLDTTPGDCLRARTFDEWSATALGRAAALPGGART
ncbi:amino acid adenylation domain-containing protein [Streptomyces cyaneofuscatus]|uniref:amino acid adenylation domain-containing protein n=1 Tax=Streptomyces cyaneofuscatus TaxID=66883 RepID=UPI0037FA6E05